MPIPEPFTAAAITGHVLGHIAATIVEHRIGTLQGTMAGRMLQWAGLAEPTFDDRVRGAVREALADYFETHPSYRLSGVLAFFSDVAVARQLGSYILDRTPIDQHEIQMALERHLGIDIVTSLLVEQRGLETGSIIPEFLDCFRRVLSAHLDEPQMALLLVFVEQSNTVIAEMRASEDRLHSVVDLLANRLDVHTSLLEHIAGDQQLIKQYLAQGHGDSLAIGNIAQLLQHLDGGPQPRRASLDVFLSYNSQDKPAVEVLARRLIGAGINLWLDRWNLVPGAPWQEAIEEALELCQTGAVFLGPAGIGPWQNEEMRLALAARVHDPARRVVPVLLPGAPEPRDRPLPGFLRRLTWVDFRAGLEDADAFGRLLAGIRGVAPGAGVQ